MTDAAVTEPALQSTNESLGWRAGLPGDLQKNETFAQFKTVGDFAKHHLEVSTKANELEGKLKDSVPKLPDNASDEDKAMYYDALGRPESASGYEFDGEDKNAPEWTNFWKGQFHGLGLTKTQAKQLSGAFNGQMQQMVKSHNDAIAKESTEAQQKLKSEMGDKYDTNVELAKRLWQKHGEQEFDKVFADGTGANRYTMIRFLLKMAALTGEDTSPQAGNSAFKGKPKSAFESLYEAKGPMPPVR